MQLPGKGKDFKENGLASNMATQVRVAGVDYVLRSKGMAQLC